jgi:hypothetical protein
MIRTPKAVLFHQCVEQDRQFAQGGDERDFLRLTARDEAFVARL